MALASFANFNSTKVQFGVSTKAMALASFANFNSTKVQFGGEANEANKQAATNFNSTKVQFGDPFAIRYSKANQISIPLRYNLETTIG